MICQLDFQLCRCSSAWESTRLKTAFKKGWRKQGALHLRRLRRRIPGCRGFKSLRRQTATPICIPKNSVLSKIAQSVHRFSGASNPSGGTPLPQSASPNIQCYTNPSSFVARTNIAWLQHNGEMDFWNALLNICSGIYLSTESITFL